MRSQYTYYAVNGFYCASWAFLTPMYPLFLLSLGLDLFEINLVFGVYLICTFLFEVPTGAIADMFGRKVSFVLSCAVRSVAFAMYWYADGLVDCLIAETVDAIGTTLATGALDAWVVDSMNDEKDRRPSGHVFARGYLYANPLMIATGLTGAYAADVDIRNPWPLGAACFALTGLLAALLMREARPAKPQWRSALASWRKTIHDGLQTVQRAPVMLWLCLLTAATSFAVMPAWHYWPARLQAVSGEGFWILGWAWALVSLSGMAGNALMPRLIGRFSRENVLVTAWLWRGGMLAIGALSDQFVPTLLAILALQAVWGLSEPTLQGWMNEHVDSDLRATVLSVRSMAFTLGGGIGLLVLGLIGRSAGIPWVWGCAAAIVILVAPGFFRLRSGGGEISRV